MEVQGKLIELLPEQSGEGKTGNAWRKQSFVIETSDQYPKKIAIDAWGDIIEKLNQCAIGNELTCSIDIESREFNSKWYTNVKAWKIEGKEKAKIPVNDVASTADPDDNLPF